MAEQPLHVAIDGRELAGRMTGVGRYLLEIMRQWSVASDARRYTVVVPTDPPAALLQLGNRFTWRVEPDRVAGTWWEQVRLPRVLARERPDVLFAPGYTAPLRGACPVVLAVYDVSFCAHPEWFSLREGLRRRWLTRASARRARTVITISEFSKREIQRYLGVPPARVVLAPPGSLPLDPPDSSPRSPLVLYVGSLFNRRHVPEMLAAFATVAASVPNARFVMVGDNRTTPPIDPRAIAAQLGIAGQVDWREYVTDDTRDDLYRTARVFLFLSDYEGFAMTPAEALAHGAPPVLLDTAISREVYGDGAVRVPADTPAIASALARLLTDDRAHASVLASGRARLSAFSWRDSAATIGRALDEAVR